MRSGQSLGSQKIYMYLITTITEQGFLYKLFPSEFQQEQKENDAYIDSLANYSPVMGNRKSGHCKKLSSSKFDDYNSKINMQAQQIIHVLNQLSLPQIQSIVDSPVEFSCRFKIMIQSQNSVKNVTIESLFQIRGNYLVQLNNSSCQIVSALKLSFNTKIKSISAFDYQDETVTSKSNQFHSQFMLTDVPIHSSITNSDQNCKVNTAKSLYFCGIDQKMGKVFLQTLLQKPVLHEVSDLRAHFRPGKIIGSGKYCKIYQASQLSNKKKVAIKSYSKQVFLNPSSYNLIKNQLVLLHNLQNPSILRPVKIYCTQNSLYIVTEICETTLQNLLAFGKQVKWSISLAQRMYRKLLSVVHYLHVNSITHGNICMSNILVRNQSSHNFELILTGFSKFKCFADNNQLDHNPQRQQMQQFHPQNKDGQQSAHRSEDIAALGQIFQKILHRVIQTNLTRASMQSMTQNKTENKCEQNVTDEGIKQAKYLLQKMTTQQEDERVDASQALNHTFFNINFDL